MLKLIGITIITLICTYVWYYWKFLILGWKINGPNILPLTVPLSLSPKTFIYFPMIHFDKTKNTRKYWLYLTWVGNIAVVGSLCPVTNKMILTSPQCADKPRVYRYFERFIGPGLITMNSKGYAKVRKLLNPAFHQRILPSFSHIINKQVDIMIRNLNEEISKCMNIDLMSHSEKCIHDISLEVIMGQEGFAQRGGDTRVLEALMQIPEFMIDKAIKVWHRPDSIYNLTETSKRADKVVNYLHECFDKAFVKKQSMYQEIEKSDVAPERNDNDDYEFENEKMKKIAIDLLFDSYKQNQLTYDNCKSQSKHLLGGAFDTSFLTLYGIIMCLAMHPDWQEKVFQEVYSMFPDNRDFQPTIEEANELRYLNMVISEVLRLIPAVPVIGREVQEDITIQDGIVIPKGTLFVVDIFNTHRNPDYWGENADDFNPEHFLPENIDNIHPYAYIPFSKGSRTCIGEKYAGYSMKIMAAKLIRNFIFSTDDKFKDLRFSMCITIRLQNVPKINVTRRVK